MSDYYAERLRLTYIIISFKDGLLEIQLEFEETKMPSTNPMPD